MTDARRAPVLVLGLGNLLLHDDAVGLRLLHVVQELHADDPEVEFVDGGTQGLALIGLFADRSAVLILDAVQLGARPGTVHGIDDAVREPPRAHAGASGGAHQQNAGDLLLAAQLLGDLPGRVAVVGIEPAVVRTGVALSPQVLAAMPLATATARRMLRRLLSNEVPSCTS